MEHGTYQDAKAFTFGIRIAIKQRFNSDIADRLLKFKADNLFVTNMSNKGYRTFYGHLTRTEFENWQTEVLRAKGHRHLA